MVTLRGRDPRCWIMQLRAVGDAEAGGALRAVDRPAEWSLEELAARLPRVCRLVGEGAGICGGSLAEILGPDARAFPDVEPRAAHVGSLAAEALRHGQARDPAELVPRYLRRAQAEVVRTGEALE